MFNHGNLDAAIEDTKEKIKDVLDESTIIKPRKLPHKLHPDLRELNKKKNQVKENYIRTLYPPNKKHLNQLTQKVKEKLGEYHNTIWNERLKFLKAQHLLL